MGDAGVHPDGNSGVPFRLNVIGAAFRVGGYEADFDARDLFTEILCD